MSRTVGPKVYIRLDGWSTGETEKAYRWKIDMPGHALDGKAVWFPKSQISEDSIDHICVAEWLVDTKIQELGED